MANLITLARLLLLFVLVAMAYWASPTVQLANAPLLLLIIGLDGVDGYVARLRGEASTFGSLFDIAVDRVVENVLWIVLGNLGLVPIWVAIVFIVRGAIVDTVRHAAAGRSGGAFAMMRSRWGRELVAGRRMRGFYGAVKAGTFGWVFFLQPWPRLAPDVWTQWSGVAQATTMALIWLSVGLCLLRGFPVVAEFVIEQKPFAVKRTALAG